jgi:hypothetical protein
MSLIPSAPFADLHRLVQINVVGRLCQTPGVSQRRPTIRDFLVNLAPLKQIAADLTAAESCNEK